MNDFRFAIRQLWKTPGFTFAAVTVLALGIGVNTAIFSLVNAMLFSPPPYKNPAEIVQVFSQDKKNPKSFRAFSYPIFSDIRAQNTVFAGLMAHAETVVGLGEKGNTHRAPADLVSSNYFSVLGVRPAFGRSFLPEEEKPGRAERVAIVSYRYWKKYSRDPSLLGHTLLINGQSFTVIGIMPKGLTETESIFSAEVWLPLGVYDEVMNDSLRAPSQSALADRSREDLIVIGRLKPGQTVATAEPALKGLAANLEKTFPVEQKDQTFMTAPLDRFSSSTDPSDPRPFYAIGILLSSMAGVVLLVACLNLANMLLARSTARRKEIAIRLALGGSRGRIVRQLLTEGFVLALLGGAGGLILGLWSIDLLAASFSKVAPFEVDWLGKPNPAVMAATLGFCVLGTLGFALGPALKLSRTSVLGDLKQHAGEDASRRRWRFLPRNPLIVAQIAFSLALLTAAALFVRSATKAASIDSGLHPGYSFLVETDASLGGFNQQRAEELYRRLQEKFAALPGSESASISAAVPFGTTSILRTVQRAGTHAAPGTEPATPQEGRTFSPWWNSVGADYFAT
ncbi:MAG: ABC transporter permease, partial [Chthoniobacterales bacterium]